MNKTTQQIIEQKTKEGFDNQIMDILENNNLSQLAPMFKQVYTLGFCDGMKYEVEQSTKNPLIEKLKEIAGYAFP